MSKLLTGFARFWLFSVLAASTLVLAPSAHAQFACYGAHSSKAKVQSFLALSEKSASKFEIISAASKLSISEKIAILESKFKTTFSEDHKLGLEKAHSIGRIQKQGFFKYSKLELLEKIRTLKLAKFTFPQRLFIIRSGFAGEISPEGRENMNDLLYYVRLKFEVEPYGLYDRSELAILELIQESQQRFIPPDDYEINHRVEQLTRENVPPEIARAIVLHLTNAEISPFDKPVIAEVRSILQSKFINLNHGLHEHGILALVTYLRERKFEVDTTDPQAKEILLKYGIDPYTSWRILEELVLPTRHLDAWEIQEFDKIQADHGIQINETRLVERAFVYLWQHAGTISQKPPFHVQHHLEEIFKIMGLSKYDSDVADIEKFINALPYSP